MLHRTLILPSLLLAASACGASAGTVNVSFPSADQNPDVGFTSWDQEANLKVLGAHLRKLGQRMLPTDQVLTIEVLHLHLAGTVMSSKIRVLNGGADWPSAHLRYTLEAPGRPNVTGEERVTDMNYLNGMTAYGDSDSLLYERRMLSRWFKERFTGGLGAPG